MALAPSEPKIKCLVVTNTLTTISFVLCTKHLSDTEFLIVYERSIAVDLLKIDPTVVDLVRFVYEHDILDNNTIYYIPACFPVIHKMVHQTFGKLTQFELNIVKIRKDDHLTMVEYISNMMLTNPVIRIFDAFRSEYFASDHAYSQYMDDVIHRVERAYQVFVNGTLIDSHASALIIVVYWTNRMCALSLMFPQIAKRSVHQLRVRSPRHSRIASPQRPSSRENSVSDNRENMDKHTDGDDEKAGDTLCASRHI